MRHTMYDSKVLEHHAGGAGDKLSLDADAAYNVWETFGARVMICGSIMQSEHCICTSSFGMAFFLNTGAASEKQLSITLIVTKG